MKGIHSTMLLAMVAGLLGGCTTMEQRIEVLRSRESVLFESQARVGRILNTGRHLAWNPVPVPVLLTETTLIMGDLVMPYTGVKQVEVGSFRSEAQLFLKETTFEDLLILRRTEDWRNGGDVVLFLPSERKRKDPLGGEAQRALAQEAAVIIEERRRGVDLFGRNDPPRPVAFAVVRGHVFELWSVIPRYLDLRFPEERKSIDALFKSVRKPATELFCSEIGGLWRPPDSAAGTYALVDIGEVDIDWLHHDRIKERVGPEARDMNSLVVMDTLRIYLREKISPQGSPSLEVTFSGVVRYYDLKASRLASTGGFSHIVTHPVRWWIDGGETGLLAEFGPAMRAIAAKVEAQLNESKREESFGPR